jgi:hypothetical protein
LKYPNTDEFWAMIQFEDDELKTKWLFCKKCAREMEKGENYYEVL